MRLGSANSARAAEQHRHFRSTLEAQGAELLDVPFIHGAYDSVFTKDNALLVRRLGGPAALLGCLMHPERKQEQRARVRALQRAGFEVVAPPRSPLEGGDIALLPDGSAALMGYGQRTSLRSAAVLEDFLGMPVVPLRLTLPELYHLDTALGVLSDGTVLACREAFPPAAWEAIHQLEGVTKVVALPLGEAVRFGTNFVEVGEVVVLGSHVPVTEAILRRLGWRPVVVPLSEFQHAGGSAACLVARLHDQDLWTTRETTAMRSTSP